MRILLQSFSFVEKNGYYNPGILYLESALRAQPDLAAELEVRKLQTDYFADLDDVAAGIAAFDPDVLGLSVYIWSIDLTERLLVRLGELGVRARVICGGPGLGHVERPFLAANPAVDVVVHGSGELAIVDLVRHFAGPATPASRLGRIAGITYRDERGDIATTSPRTVRLPMSRLSSPYTGGFHELPAGSAHLMLETERFCPYRCSYCTWYEHHGARRSDMRFRMEQVRENLDWAASHGFADVNFFDSAINSCADRFAELLDAVDAVAEPHGPLTYFFFLHLHRVTPQQIRRLQSLQKQALVFLGVESFSPRALRLAHRPDDLAALRPVLEALAANPNLKPMVGLMLGLPGDSVDRFQRGVESLLEVPRVQMLVSLLSVAPGTELRRDAARYRFRFPATGVPLLLGSRAFPPAELERAFARIGALIPCGRISLNPLYVPLRRLRNPRLIPAAARRALTPEQWVRVGVVGIGGGTMEGRGLYPDL